MYFTHSKLCHKFLIHMKSKKIFQKCLNSHQIILLFINSGYPVTPLPVVIIVEKNKDQETGLMANNSKCNR